MAPRRAVVFAGAAAALGAAQQPDPFNCSQLPLSAFERITLTNNVPGMSASFIPYGATIVNLLVPSATAGGPVDVLLGFDDTTMYCNAMVNGTPAHPYFGAAIGRVANRIAGGQFTLDGVNYSTPINEVYKAPPSGNDGAVGDTLHGGTVGWDRRVWSVLRRNASSVTFGLLSPDGDMGFPGDLAVTVTYTLTDKGADGAPPAWDVAYAATTSAPVTVVAMSQHAYWNLNANYGGAPDALDHVVSIAGDAFVAVDANLIPTGALPSVATAPWMDFRAAKPLGRDISNGTVAPGGGYDNAWVWLDDWQPGVLTPRVTMASPTTGVALAMSTDQPSVQGYR